MFSIAVRLSASALYPKTERNKCSCSASGSFSISMTSLEYWLQPDSKVNIKKMDKIALCRFISLSFSFHQTVARQAFHPQSHLLSLCLI